MKKYLFFILLVTSLCSCKNKKTKLEGLWNGGIKSTTYGDSVIRKISLEFRNNEVTSIIYDWYEIDEQIEIRTFKLKDNKLIINDASSDLSASEKERLITYTIISQTQDSLILSKPFSKSGLFLRKSE